MNEEKVVFQCPESRALYPNLSNKEQTLAVVAALCYIATITIGLLRFYKYMDGTNVKWWSTLKRTWPFLGVVYLLVGISDHFIKVDEELCLVPPNGTWGWWYMPVSREFQLKATGYAEVIGGTILLGCGIVSDNKRSTPLRPNRVVWILLHDNRHDVCKSLHADTWCLGVSFGRAIFFETSLITIGASRSMVEQLVVHVFSQVSRR